MKKTDTGGGKSVGAHLDARLLRVMRQPFKFPLPDGARAQFELRFVALEDERDTMRIGGLSAAEMSVALLLNEAGKLQYSIFTTSPPQPHRPRGTACRPGGTRN